MLTSLLLKSFQKTKVTQQMIEMIRFFLIVFIVSAALPLKAQTIKWAYGAGSEISDYNTDVEIDSQGNVYAVGFSSGGTVLGDNYIHERILHIIKHSPGGEMLWVKSISYTPGMFINDFHIDNNNRLYICGECENNNMVFDGKTIEFDPQHPSYILALDSDGEYLWAKTFSGHIRQVKGYNDDVYFSGIFVENMMLDDIYLECENLGYFVGKLNASLNVAWAESGSKVTGVYSLEVDSKGDAYLVGNSETRTFGIGDQIITTPGRPSFIVKYGSGGGLLWFDYFYGTTGGTNCPVDLAIDNEDNVFLSAYLNTAHEFNHFRVEESGTMLLKYNSSGRILWYKLIEHCFSGGQIVVEEDNSIVIALNNSNMERLDLFPGPLFDVVAGTLIIKFHPLGHQQWVKNTFGGISDMAVGLNKNIFFAGSYNEAFIDFDGHTIINNSWNNDDDMFVACLNDPVSLFCPIVEPKLVGSKDYLCEGDSMIITMDRSFGSWFYWMHNGVETAFTDSVLTITDEGLYQLYINAGTQCPFVSDIIDIKKYASPKINLVSDDSTIICPGVSVKLKTYSEPGYHYTWFSDGVEISNANDFLLIAENPAQYKVEVSNGYCDVKDSIDINFMDLPDVEMTADSIKYIGLPVPIVPVSNRDAICYWYYNDDINEFSREQYIQTNLPGKYLVVARNYCGLDVDDIIVYDERVGVDDILNETLSVKLYPNPAAVELTIEISGFKPGSLLLEIINIKGECIKEESHSVFSDYEKLKIDVSGFTTGNYFLRVKNNNKSYTRKFLVKNL